ncbi:hypothetical protein [Mycobacterium sp. ITM-2016-00318]|uniref:hypothetical protein n=1 Tax=Mycobacterium sp. ITM-2016-00318 TaxID=2099693 RepID=UPI000CF87D06|nr:hypothetical protein [Mycobacterium sp. ITM-2016-00318]WNG90974.1 hypothetical protein C6A82_015670 [Mycobacterium sp. ITM-2016-00318]
MTLKSLVTGVAAVAAVGGAAVGVTSIASPAIAFADQCVDAGTLQGVVDTLIAPGGDFAGPKGQLISPPLGFTTGKLANGTLRNLYAKGTLPTSISIAQPSCSGPTATSQISAAGQTMPITFVNEAGTWKVTAASASSVINALG